MRTRVHVAFPANRPDRPSWPYIGYDVEKRSKEITSLLAQRLPEIEFSSGVYYTPEEAEESLKPGRDARDGYLVYMTAMWNGVGELYARNARPVIVADELYSGSGGLLRVQSVVKKENLPVVLVASSDFQDIIDNLRLFAVMKRMRESTILVVADGDTWGARQPTVDGALETFGTRCVRIGADALEAHYRQADPAEVEHWKTTWMREALKTVEPSEEEVGRSARMYLALKAAMHEAGADAVTIDCLGLYYAGRLSAYPCLGLFQLNNDGSTGVCEADVDSTITQLLIRYLTGRPGYVSDPVVDTATSQIIYAHCVATNRPYGPEGMANPYIIRSHAEDGRGASVQSLLPLGQPVTTAKVSVRNKAFAVHTGKTVANVNDDKACRTKLAVAVDAQRILDNYHSDIFSWHRVTFYGDYSQQMVNLATLYGLRVYREDQ